MSKWQKIETAPKGVKVIAGYLNEAGKWRSIMARYFEANTLDAADDSDDEFAPEGWYEESETQDNLNPCPTPTHWMPLPTPPEGS